MSSLAPPSSLALTLRSIELQLVLRLLPTLDRFRFAVCCKATLQTASSPFAWSNAAPILRSSATPVSAASLVVRGFIPVHYRMQPRFTPGHYRMRHIDSDASVTADYVSALLASPLNIVHLDASLFMRCSTKLWLLLLQCGPFADRLIGITMHAGRLASPPMISGDLLFWLLRFSSLQSLRMGAPMMHADGWLSKLPYPPSLTRLSIRDSMACPTGCLSLFKHCSNLRHLSVVDLCFNPVELSAFLQLPSMSNLQSLRLVNYAFMVVPIAEIDKLLFSRLKVVHLVDCGHIEGTAPLCATNQLQQLLIEHRSKVPARMSSSLLDALQRVMQAIPDLQLTFLFVPTDLLAFSDRCYQYVAPLQEQFGDWRVRMRKSFCKAYRGYDKQVDPDPEDPFSEAIARSSKLLRVRATDAAPASALVRLPTVLHHLIFQGLTVRERARLSLCCCGLYASANSPIAWHHARVEIVPEALRGFPDGPIGLARHPPLALCYAPPSRSYSLCPPRELAIALTRRPNLNLIEFDNTHFRCQYSLAYGMELFRSSFARVLSLPACMRLRVVALCFVNLLEFDALSRLPLVEVFRLRPPAGSPRDPFTRLGHTNRLSSWMHIGCPPSVALIEHLDCILSLREIQMPPPDAANPQLMQAFKHLFENIPALRFRFSQP